MKPLHTLSGVALLEALVALGGLAFALLGLLALQMRTGTDGHLAAQRTLATRLAQDLFERVKANPGGAAVFQAYLTPTDRPEAALDPVPGPLMDCRAQPCGPLALAAWDLDQWQQQLGRDLPLGRATVFVPEGSAGQLGVLLAWRANEAAHDARYFAPLQISPLPGRPLLRCPEGQICQLLYTAP